MNTEHVALSIVIPCYNEAKNITTVIQMLEKLIEQHPANIEVLVIDGGSDDQTPQELKSLFQTLCPKHFKLLLQTHRGGYGADIMQALSQAQGEVLAWTHADLQTDPQDILTAFDLYMKNMHKDQPCIIKGDRKNRQWLEAFFTWGMQCITYGVLGTYLSDINAQPKLFSRHFYTTHLKKNHPDDFSLDLFLLYQAKKHGYRIENIPVIFKKRQHGIAKGGGGGWSARLKLIKRTWRYIIALKAHTGEHCPHNHQG